MQRHMHEGVVNILSNNGAGGVWSNSHILTIDLKGCCLGFWIIAVGHSSSSMAFVVTTSKSVARKLNSDTVAPLSWSKLSSITLFLADFLYFMNEKKQSTWAAYLLHSFVVFSSLLPYVPSTQS